MWDPKQDNSISDDKASGFSSNQKDSEFDSAIGSDSGFLSGPQSQIQSSSEISIQEDKKISESRNTFSDNLDSGLIEDSEEDSSENQANDIQMLLDSGVGLSEWFCNLSMKNNTSQPLNNFGKQSSKKSATIKQSNRDWEIYYQKNEDGDTQLHIAIIHGLSQNIILELITLSPHPWFLDIQNDIAQSPLHLAVLTGQPQIARLLLVSGAEATIRDRHGNTPLHLACINGDLASVRALTQPITMTEIPEVLRKGDRIQHPIQILPQDLEERNYDGERCVHLATQGNHIEILSHLVGYGADINAREGKSGFTPLHLAIEKENQTLANVLLKFPKLSIETETYAGLTAYQLAVSCSNQTLLIDLKKYGAEILNPPESSDDESDIDDFQIDQFGTTSFFQKFHGGKTINVS